MSNDITRRGEAEFPRRGFESPTHVSGLRWEEKSVCTACVWGLVLINLHPVSGSVEDGFELCRMYGSQSSP